jgi:hypothetical protein
MCKYLSVLYVSTSCACICAHVSLCMHLPVSQCLSRYNHAYLCPSPILILVFISISISASAHHHHHHQHHHHHHHHHPRPRHHHHQHHYHHQHHHYIIIICRPLLQWLLQTALQRASVIRGSRWRRGGQSWRSWQRPRLHWPWEPTSAAFSSALLGQVKTCVCMYIYVCL